MSDLFISYASEDRSYVMELVEEFESQGFTVWWDHHIEPGTSFDRSIEEALDDSSCVVVVWSEYSINSDWVRAEAAEGLARNILLPILLDDVKPPLLFRQKQAISLVDWKASTKHSRAPLKALIPSISQILESYDKSQLPVSTQRTWVQGEVKNNTDNEMLGGAANSSLSIALSYFEKAFRYESRRRGTSTQLTQDQLSELVKQEGLDGYICGEINGSDENLKFVLRIQQDDQEPIVKTYRIDNAHSLPRQIGEALIDNAKVLQGSKPKKCQAMLDYLTRTEVEVLHLTDLAEQYTEGNRWEENRETYQKALKIDDAYVHAIRGFALASMKLGQRAEAREVMGRMVRSIREDESDRAILFNRGVYHAIYTEDYDKAAEEFESLLKISPLDEAVINNLAVSRFYQLEFAAARELSERALQLYPTPFLKLNAAYYSLYAGEFNEADNFAQQVLAGDSSWEEAVMIRALYHAEKGDLNSARKLITSHTDHSDREDTLLLQSLADLEMAAQKWDVAEELLDRGITIDERLGNQENHARKLLMKAEVCLCLNADIDVAKALMVEAIRLSNSAPTLATYALLCARFGIQELEQVIAAIRNQVNSHARAFAKMIRGIDAWLSGDLGVAINLLKESSQIVDLWFIHFCMAHIFQQSELLLEAGDEILNCLERPGEAVCGLLDDLPTYRYLEQTRNFEI